MKVIHHNSKVKAKLAILAAKNKHIWQRGEARKFAEHHGVCYLFRLACQLEAAKNLA